MSKHFIVTIGREFGSGGRETGIILSKKLGVKCYDKELLRECALNSNLNESYLETVDEKSPGLFMAPPMVSMSTAEIQMPSIKAYVAQFEAIKKIAERESCIIIGRCSDYVLAERNDVVNVFIYAGTGYRIHRLRELHGISEKEAKTLMLKEDRKRAAYYEYYTDKKWGARRSYDLCINTEKFGTQGAADIIARIVNEKNADK